MKRWVKAPGSLMDFLPACVSILAITLLMMAYISSMSILDQKTQISQLTRQMMLQMETKGFMSLADQAKFQGELTILGLTDIDLSGSTMSDVGYGNQIILSVKGNISGEKLRMEGGLFDAMLASSTYAFQEKLVSTAKN